MNPSELSPAKKPAHVRPDPLQNVYPASAGAPSAVKSPEEQVAFVMESLAKLLSRCPHLTIPRLATVLVKMLEPLPIAHRIKVIQNMGLLLGLDPAAYEPKFLDRLAKAPWQKGMLAKYCFKQELSTELKTLDGGAQHAARKVFFESGSSIAYVIGEFAKRAFKARLEPGTSSRVVKTQVLTNNLFGLTALAGLVAHVEPIRGRLDPKYYGFFPFADDASSHSPSDWAQDLEEFWHLRKDIEECDLVFGTCSNFSFLAGPIVGSRANALVKRAMYSGKEEWKTQATKRFYLLFHLGKIVPICKELANVSRPKLRCCCVFPRPQGLTWETSEDAIRWNCADPEESIEGPTWNSSLQGKPALDVKVPIEELHKNKPDNYGSRGVPSLEVPWIGSSAPGTRLLIGLPQDQSSRGNAWDWLQEEVMQANHIISRVPHAVRYELASKAEAIDSAVALVVVKSGKSGP